MQRCKSRVIGGDHTVTQEKINRSFIPRCKGVPLIVSVGGGVVLYVSYSTRTDGMASLFHPPSRKNHPPSGFACHPSARGEFTDYMPQILTDMMDAHCCCRVVRTKSIGTPSSLEK